MKPSLAKFFKPSLKEESWSPRGLRKTALSPGASFERRGTNRRTIRGCVATRQRADISLYLRANASANGNESTHSRRCEYKSRDRDKFCYGVSKWNAVHRRQQGWTTTSAAAGSLYTDVLCCGCQRTLGIPPSWTGLLARSKRPSGR